jgi:cytoskeletal protein CcmA (bactofilin family)
MFTKNANRRTRDDAIVPTIVDSEMTVKGNLTSGGELHVAGKVDGDVEVKTLTVGKDAVIRGTVTAEKVRVCGEIIGCIRAREVTLAATARVVGDVHHDVLSIEAGALLEGHCRRREAAKGEVVRPSIPLGGKPSEAVRPLPSASAPVPAPIPVAAQLATGTR